MDNCELSHSGKKVIILERIVVFRKIIQNFMFRLLCFQLSFLSPRGIIKHHSNEQSKSATPIHGLLPQKACSKDVVPAGAANDFDACSSLQDELQGVASISTQQNVTSS